MNIDEKRLLKHFRALSDSGRSSLIDFAEFLVARDPVGSRPTPTVPLDIARPEQESVVKAIKRLMATYPMLEREKLLNDTSAQMTRHIVHKHTAVAVIDELELIFQRHYKAYLNANEEPET